MPPPATKSSTLARSLPIAAHVWPTSREIEASAPAAATHSESRPRARAQRTALALKLEERRDRRDRALDGVDGACHDGLVAQLLPQRRQSAAHVARAQRGHVGAVGGQVLQRGQREERMSALALPGEPARSSSMRSSPARTRSTCARGIRKAPRARRERRPAYRPTVRGRGAPAA